MAKIKVEKLCVLCGQLNSIEVDEDRYRKWIDGNGHVQDIFPDLTPGEREVLISGSHEECFDKVFGGDDD